MNKDDRKNLKRAIIEMFEQNFGIKQDLETDSKSVNQKDGTTLTNEG